MQEVVPCTMCSLSTSARTSLKSGRPCKMKRWHPLLGRLMVSEKLVDIKDASKGFIPSKHGTSSLKELYGAFYLFLIGQEIDRKVISCISLVHVSFPWQLLWHSEL